MAYFYTIFLFVPFALLACTPSTEKPKHTETQVSVTGDPYNIPGSDKIDTHYTLTEGDCKVAWQTISTKKEQNIEVSMINRTECKKPFAEVTSLHNKVIARILKDNSPAFIKGLATGGLKSLQPDGSWNAIVANAAATSKDYQDYRRNYPEHATKKSINTIFVDLVLQTQPHVEFKKMLAAHGLNVELEHVEKVFNSKNEKGEETIHDAGLFWWKVISN